MLSMCLCIPTINFWMAEQIFMKLGMYVMESKLTSKVIGVAYTDHRSVRNFDLFNDDSLSVIRTI
jgi:hypothetical protein